MRRLIALTMVAGLMSFGAIAGQTSKPSVKTAAPPAAATASPTQTPASAEHGQAKPVKKVKKHASTKKHQENTTPTAPPKN